MAKKEATITINVAIPRDAREVEKLDKHQVLKDEIIKMWGGGQESRQCTRGNLNVRCSEQEL